MKGIFEFDLGEKKIGFKFGTYALGVACKEEGCALNELFEKIKASELLALMNLFYGAAVHYAKSKKQEINFTASDVSDWLDELGVDKTTDMITNGLNQYDPKNSTSPA